MRTEKIALLIIRFAAAGTMLLHGIARIVNAGVTPFDGFLTGFGFPAYTAWAITIFEIGAALALLLNKWVAVICTLFILQLLMGIILVHGREGWFVVGAGRNGVEYSVLLILCFVSTALASRKSN
ncbi:MAG: DoxX family protein [Cyclobacteriaceae bacterium]|nr:DoxX family protein [Cytophagales bacterium]MBX2899661.1 DoxX family protein [Cyclobacteriaceae bacterium]